jgi:hypothetical protein
LWLRLAPALTILILLGAPSLRTTATAAEPTPGQKDVGAVNPQDLPKLKKLFGDNLVIIELTADRKGEAFQPVKIEDVIELFGKAYLHVSRDGKSMLIRADTIVSIRELGK